MKTKLLVCLIFTLLFLKNVNAQRRGVTPPSIGASSLGIYGDVPVDLSKGTMDINVPIHTITVGEEEFPIGLSYNASGIKVNQQASSVGLAWSMNSSPLVTRVVRGLPDDIYNSPPVDLIVNPDMKLHPNYYVNRQFTTYENAGYFYSKAEVNTVKDISSTSLSVSGNVINYSDVSLTVEQKQTMRKLSLGALDSEPDEFYFNLFGASGKFVFDADKNIHLFSKSTVTIVPTITAAGIEKFKIITSSGIIYHFELKETTQNHEISFFNGYDTASNIGSNNPIYKYVNYYWYCLGCGPVLETDGANPRFNFNNPTSILKNYDPRQKSASYTSAWRVTKIEVPGFSDVTFSYESRRVLDFQYSKSLESGRWIGPRDNSLPQTPNPPTYNSTKKIATVENYSASVSITEEKFLTGIQWRTGSIDFTNIDRADIPNANITATYQIGNSTIAPSYQFITEKSRAVSFIKVNDMIKGDKSFNFTYGYFQVDNCQSSGEWDAYCKRLRLDQIKLNDESFYKFEYENQFNLPSLNSLQKDFWGYYNGYNNTDEIPTLYYYYNLYGNLENSEHFSCFSIYPLQNQGSGIVINNAENMVPNIDYAKTGTLKRITYPTKGYSEFKYELNTFLLEGVEKPGPGLRISKVIYNDLVSPQIEKNYSYKAGNGLGSGNLSMLPVFTRLRYGTGPYNGYTAAEAASLIRDKAIFYSISNTMGRAHSVDYQFVTASSLNNGREEYVFDVPIKIGQKKDNLQNSEYVFNVSTPNIKISPECWAFVNDNSLPASCSKWYSSYKTLDYFPFASAPNYSWNTGQLLQKHTYNSAGQKVSSIINSYNVTGVEKTYYFKTGISYAHLKAGGSVTSAPESSIAASSDNKIPESTNYGVFTNILFQEGTYDYYFTKPYYLSAFKYLAKTEEISYPDINNPVSTSREYVYGTDKQVKSITTATSKNDEKNIVRYKHITDYLNKASLGTTVISKPIEIIYEKTLPEDPAFTVVTGGEIFKYTNNLLSKYYKLNSGQKLFRKPQDLNYLGAGYYKNSSTDSGGNILFDPAYELFSDYVQYDAFGNCLEFKTDYGATKHIFVFGYSDKLLVADILNSSYSEVQASTNLSSLRSASGASLKQYLDLIRAGLPNAMVTSYSYFDADPYYSLFKLQSITDPAGRSIFYDYYNNSGKLRFIKDNDGKVIEEFKYNYKTN